MSMANNQGDRIGGTALNYTQLRMMYLIIMLTNMDTMLNDFHKWKNEDMAFMEINSAYKGAIDTCVRDLHFYVKATAEMDALLCEAWLDYNGKAKPKLERGIVTESEFLRDWSLYLIDKLEQS
jgi:hypothetical protein